MQYEGSEYSVGDSIDFTVEITDPCATGCCIYPINPTVDASAVINTLTPCSTIVLEIPDTECYEEVSGWEAMYYNLDGS